MPDFVSGNEVSADGVSGSADFEEVTVFPMEVPYGLVRSSNGSYAQWQDSFSYSLGDVVSYNGKFYECIYAHTSNLSWLPDGTPTLWKEISATVSGSDVPGIDIPGGFESADVEALVNVCMAINQNVVSGISAILVMLGFLIGIILVRGLGGFLKGV